MRVSKSLILITLSALVISFAEANDPSPLQDFCVAIGDLKNGGKYKTRILELSTNY